MTFPSTHTFKKGTLSAKFISSLAKSISFLAAFLLLSICSCEHEKEDIPEDFSEIKAAFSAHPKEIVVHRGANHMAPENTFAAARLCIEMGLDYVEIDVRRSKDGVHFIMHDQTVNRTTQGNGYIKTLMAKEIQALDAGSWFSKDYKGEVVPELFEYLKWIKGQAKVYLDIKEADLEKIAKMIRDLEMEQEVFVWFKDASLAAEWVQIAPDIPIKGPP